MIYAEELEAIHMAVVHAKDLMQKESRIFFDSQCVMKSIAKSKRQLGQAIIAQILDEIDILYLTTSSYVLRFEWVPRLKGMRRQTKRQRV